MKEFLETGRRLKEARVSVGFSQSELAKAAKVTPAAIGNFEQGLRRPSHKNADAFERIFGLPSCYWMGDLSRAEAEVIAAMRKTTVKP